MLIIIEKYQMAFDWSVQGIPISDWMLVVIGNYKMALDWSVQCMSVIL